ncbi:MAG: DUF488 domain-containing protein [Thermoguttaceae bacterium]
MSSEKLTIFTIGHSNHSLEDFLALLNRHHITAIADVRSSPYGRLEHFNREIIAAGLMAAGIEYIFMGRELGARREEQECYQDGMAVYEKIAVLPAFQEGLSRLRRLALTSPLAIMCAEKEPLDCHRTILICRHLRDSGLQIKHILADAGLEDHERTEKRLVKKMGIERTLFEPDLSEEEMIRRAYDKRGLEIAFRYNYEEMKQ